MAPVKWSDLPDGILDLIANKLVRSDIDILRLRSVCSPWRSCLSPPPMKPLSFPVKVPAVCTELLCCNRNKGCYKARHGYYYLHENTLYRLSSPHDPSNGWLFKASETNPNTFSLLIPFGSSQMTHYLPMTIPKHLNLLDYQISEISKSYRLNGVNCDGFPKDIVVTAIVKKVTPLFNYVVDCDFVALALAGDDLSYCKIGDEKFTRIDTKGRKIHDVTFYDGRCFAIDSKGVLLFLDSKLQLFVAASSPSNFCKGQFHYLVNCDKDLYMASKTYGERPEVFRQYIKRFELEIGFAVMLNKFNKYSGSWDCIEDLEDKVFLLSDDGSVGVSTKDFKGCKGNCVYLTDIWFGDDNESKVYGYSAVTYHMDKHRAVKMAADKDSKKLYWPPPGWLMASASSSESSDP